MYKTLTIDLSDDIFLSIKKSPAEFVQAMRLAAAVKWYEVGMVSQSKAAEIAGVSRQKFLDATSQFKVSPFQTTPNELEQELAND